MSSQEGNNVEDGVAYSPSPGSAPNEADSTLSISSPSSATTSPTRADFSSSHAVNDVPAFDKHILTTITKPPPQPPAHIGPKKRIDNDISKKIPVLYTPHAQIAVDVRPASIKHSHPTGGASARRISDKDKEGIDVVDLIKYLTDKGGRVHLEDVQTFMLNASLSTESAVGTTVVCGRNIGGKKQPEIGTFPQQGVDIGLTKKEDVLHVTNSNSILLSVKKVVLT